MAPGDEDPSVTQHTRREHPYMPATAAEAGGKWAAAGAVMGDIEDGLRTLPSGGDRNAS